MSQKDKYHNSYVPIKIILPQAQVQIWYVCKIKCKLVHAFIFYCDMIIFKRR